MTFEEGGETKDDKCLNLNGTAWFNMDRGEND